MRIEVNNGIECLSTKHSVGVLRWMVICESQVVEHSDSSPCRQRSVEDGLVGGSVECGSSSGANQAEVRTGDFDVPIVVSFGFTSRDLAHVVT